MTDVKQNNMDWDMSEAYERYASSVPSTVKNERMRPEGQSIFDWLLEDKELIYETDRDIRKAGFDMLSAIGI